MQAIAILVATCPEQNSQNWMISLEVVAVTISQPANQALNMPLFAGHIAETEESG